MMRALVLVVALSSCAFATKHPAITAGIVTGTIALVPCLPAVEHPTTCLAIGAGAGAAIGGITGLVTLFADTTDHSLPPDTEPGGITRVRVKKTPATTPAPEPEPAPLPPFVPPPAEPPPAQPTAPPDAGVPAPDAAP